MIVIGTEIGAGILALPIITAKLGFLYSMLIMIASWCLMVYTALLVTDINLKMPEGTSFAKMAGKLLGRPGEIISWLSFLILLYAISIAYISAASSAFSNMIPSLSQHSFAVIFVLVFSVFVLKGVGAVDVFNRLLVSVKLIIFLLVCLTIAAYIHPVNLLGSRINTGIFLLSIPIIVTSFTSHLIIPSLRCYLDSDPKVLFRVLLIGSTVPLIMYTLWELVILGAVPLEGPSSFMGTIFSHKPDVRTVNIGDVLNLVSDKIDASTALISINAFSYLAIMTSYLGVSLALYHFILDSFGLQKLKSRVCRTGAGAILTFAVPLAIVLSYPDLFVRALGYVGVCVCILLVILPVAMVIKLNKMGIALTYKISSVKWGWAAAIIAAVGVISAEILSHYVLIS